MYFNLKFFIFIYIQLLDFIQCNYKTGEKLYKVEGWIVNSPYIEEEIKYGSIRCELNNDKYLAARVSVKGRFVIHGVPLGQYRLNVYSPEYYFEQYRIDLTLDENNRLKISAFPLREGASFNSVGEALPLPLKISPKLKYKYFKDKPSFNVYSILSSPMTLMTLLSLVMIFFLPKLLQGMDPEVLKEVQETQNSLHSTLNKFKDGPSLSETLAKLSK